MKRHDVMFWFCIGLAALDLMLASICRTIPSLNGYVDLYLICASLCSVGAVANYMNCKFEEQKDKKGK